MKTYLKIAFHYFDKFTHVPRIFRIAYLLQPHQVINITLAHLFLLTVPILDLRHISPYTFRPMVKFIVLSGFGIGKTKQVVSVSAEWRTEPPRFQYGLCQYNLWMLDAVADDFLIEIGNSECWQRFSF